MRISHMFGTTLRQAPAEAEITSHKLLLRAGAVRQLAAGIYSYLPLGWRVIRKIERIMQEEMDAIGGQEIGLPILHPAEIWQETGRWYDVGPEMVRLKDRADRDFVLGMTHEEIVTDLARREIRSYRQLPFMAYQIQRKIRDEARPRGGIIRLREFLMKDAYSFHPDQASIDEYYPSMYQAYHNIFRRAGLNVIAVEADTGMMGGTGSHEFMLLSPNGEDTVVVCSNCDYAANLEKAEFVKPEPVAAATGLPTERVSTPGVKTIEALAAFLNLPQGQMLKTVAYSTGEQLVAAIIRGDLEVNEAKLAKVLGTANYHLASDEELRAAGIHPGYMSPVGLKGVRVIADDSLKDGSEYVAGANEPDAHLLHVHMGRDVRPDDVADIASAREGDTCTRCGGTLRAQRGIEVGHTFKLGTRYSSALGADYLGPDGKQHPIVMGSYGIGLDRLVAAIVEQNHDDKGIIWPRSVAPLDIHLVALGVDDPNVAAYGEEVYKELQAAGFDVLYDDREETPGVKFNDADLIGLPLRLTVSPRNIREDRVEAKLRSSKEATLVPRAALVRQARELLDTAP